MNQLEEKHDPPKKNTARHTYLLYGDSQPHDLPVISAHLKDTVGRNVKVMKIYDGAIRFTCDKPITRDDVGLHKLPLVLYYGPDTDHLHAPELVFFSPLKLTLTDLVRAGIAGLVGLRKWKPNRATNRPNEGYTGYCFNEDFAALAFSEESVIVKDTGSIMFRISAPPPSLLPNGMTRELYWKDRAAQFIERRKVLSVEWKEVAYNTTQAIKHLLPEYDPAQEILDHTQFGTLQREHEEIRSTLKTLQLQTTRNTELLTIHSETLEEHSQKLTALEGITKDISGLTEMSIKMLQILETANKEDPQYPSTQVQDTVDPVERKESEVMLIDDRTQTNHESPNKKLKVNPYPNHRKCQFPSTTHYIDPHYEKLT